MINLDRLKCLIDLASDPRVAELEVNQDDFRLKITMDDERQMHLSKAHQNQLQLTSIMTRIPNAFPSMRIRNPI